MKKSRKRTEQSRWDWRAKASDAAFFVVSRSDEIRTSLFKLKLFAAECGFVQKWGCPKIAILLGQLYKYDDPVDSCVRQTHIWYLHLWCGYFIILHPAILIHSYPFLAFETKISFGDGVHITEKILENSSPLVLWCRLVCRACVQQSWYWRSTPPRKKVLRWVGPNTSRNCFDQRPLPVEGSVCCGNSRNTAWL